MADPMDRMLSEWQECRTTIGRFDTILTDLRKLGFSLVTGLITAGAILADKGTDLRVGAWPPVFCALTLLILGLFVVDRYYQVLQWAAVRRAKELEPGLFTLRGSNSVTVHISGIASKAYNDIYVGLIYATFVVGAFILAAAVITDPLSLILVGLFGLLCLVAGCALYLTTRRVGRSADEESRAAMAAM